MEDFLSLLILQMLLRNLISIMAIPINNPDAKNNISMVETFPSGCRIGSIETDNNRLHCLCLVTGKVGQQMTSVPCQLSIYIIDN